MTKTFQIIGVSSNTNSFGLRGVRLVARDGLAFEAGASTHTIERHGLRSGSHIALAMIDGGDGLTDAVAWFDWAGAGFEIPRALPHCPKHVVKSFWITPANPADKTNLKRLSRAGQAHTAMANYRSK